MRILPRIIDLNVNLVETVSSSSILRVEQSTCFTCHHTQNKTKKKQKQKKEKKSVTEILITEWYTKNLEA